MNKITKEFKKKMISNFILFFCLIIISASISNSSLKADVLLLNDGREYKGKLKIIKENSVLFTAENDSNIIISPTAVKSINLQKIRQWSDKKKITEINDNIINQYYNLKIDSLKFKDPGIYNLYSNILYKNIKANRWEITKTVFKKILKKRSEAEGIVSYYYYDKFDTPLIICAFSIDSEGNLHHLDDNALRSESIINNPQYENLRRYRFSLPETKTGAYFYYQTKIIRDYDNDKMPFYIQQIFSEPEPVIHKSIDINIPESMKINYSLNLKDTIKSSITKKNNRINYSFSVDYIEGYINEENMPPSEKIFPSINIALTDDWQRIFSGFYNGLEKQLKNYWKIKDIFDKIGINKNASELQKARKIYDFVIKNFDYIPVEPDYFSYMFNDIETLKKTMYGNSFDKTLFLMCLLKNAGINANFIMCKNSNENILNKNIPVIRQFDGSLCKIEINGEKIFLAPFNQTMPFGVIPQVYHNTEAVELFSKNKYNYLTIPAAQNIYDDGYLKKMKIKLNDDDSIEVDEIYEFYGNSSVSPRSIVLSSEEEQKKYFEETVSNIDNNAELIDYSFSENNIDTRLFIMRQNYKIKEYVLSAGKNIRAFRIPCLTSEGFRFSDTKRLYDIKWNGHEFTGIQAEINIPENYDIYFLPADVKLNIENSNITFNRKFLKTDSIITFISDYYRKTDYVNKQNYHELRSFYETIAKKSEDWIIITLKK